MRSVKELKTLEDFLNFAKIKFEKEGLFFGHGTDNAWDEAVALVLFCMDLPHRVSAEVRQQNVTEPQKKRILALIEKRIETRKPLAYLTKEAYFSSLSFYVDERVLIPRSPIAELIENQFSPWIKPEKVKNILDLGTGSGCIGIACAYAFPEAHIDMVDINSDCLLVAKKNIQKHQKEKQVQLIQSNLFETIPIKAYDIIVSNPPYVDQKDMEALPQEYLHEPKAALYGGEDGLDIVEIILAQAKSFLNPHGILVIEVGNSEDAIEKKFPRLPLIWLEFERGGGGVFLLNATDL
ncbi:MAG: hypothetical protein ACD_44C00008G0006 [uncultured bacterium]|nr:MAG: hypothetical protein ACD_44C00008G0006 [uncultured bacterium]OGT16907.1 MAG: ribosomal protein L3 N(5)-glutamine methyltransferase [Gammaproteobacteria bacterium RIFCSPHIGHO2_02_FULL_38_33]OGT24379.1 MAG: ribosomal protein L3 N(5)-glutamine methyltransferase [Gammaproteobacteria bacterium RIFCSPHIGHO2_12_38_15]OGT68581.1 MAG: ribosomal protein L3 N(5)-glutamine methyltransferase [Gammaproteobacteria bacterium RIFCSPLOWO2_02_FULL_38_11]OGT75604.1 MAG: ribosomal protein L3 N(5)-glutamine 